MKARNYTAKISQQGQITLPAELRKRLGVQPGARVVLRESNNGAIEVDKITGGSDAAEYVRKLRDQEQKRQTKKYGRLK